jgi:hypothetical protein
MEAFADLNLIGYLYNTCYGGFGFSEKFIERLNEIRKEAGLEPVTPTYEGRTDDMVIALFQEMGPSEASGPFASLKLAWVPDVFLEHVYVNEYDGKESISIVDSEVYTKILKTFLEERRRNPSLTLDDLEARYENAKTKLARYSEYHDSLIWKR